MAEMVPAPEQQIPVPSSGGSPSKWVILLVVVIIALAGGIFYLSTPQSKPKQTANNNVSPTPSKNDLKGPFAYAQRTTIPTTIVCYRFTSLKEALMNIEAACILDLSGKGINLLPNEITKLTKLNEINLSNNNFSEFPSQLLEIPKLRIIDLSKNKLTTTPNVSKLKDLQSLILTGNPITNKTTPTSAPVPSQASGSAITPPPNPFLKITY